mgnify:CR=1 FL=1
MNSRFFKYLNIALGIFITCVSLNVFIGKIFNPPYIREDLLINLYCIVLGIFLSFLIVRVYLLNNFTTYIKLTSWSLMIVLLDQALLIHVREQYIFAAFLISLFNFIIIYALTWKVVGD